MNFKEETHLSLGHCQPLLNPYRSGDEEFHADPVSSLRPGSVYSHP
jgi:hypothetical protein